MARHSRQVACAALGLVLLLAVPATAELKTSPIVDWFNVLQQYIRDTPLQNQIAARYFGLLGQSIYGALQDNRKGNNNEPKYNDTAVAAFAAHTLLTHWYPSKFYIQDRLIARQLDGLSKDELSGAKDIGYLAANKVIDARTGDGYDTWANFKPAPPGTDSIGKYQFTPNQTYALYPQLADVLPFVLTPKEADDIASKYINGHKNYFKSDEYYKDLEEVRTIGGSTSDRSEYDQASPGFWADGAGTATIGGHWLNITYATLPDNLSIWEQALFFARFGAATADASIVAWKPITAIRSGDGGNNYTADPNWTPFLSTPNHPDYVSGHQATVGGAAQVLRDWLGQDKVEFELGTENPQQNKTRKYTSITQAADEVGYSRTLAGLHFRRDNVDGLALGEDVAKIVITRIK